MTYKVLIYGANGHSGELIARRAACKEEDDAPIKAPSEAKPLDDVQLILAGRSGGRLAKLARDLGVPYRVFALGDRAEVVRNLVGVDLVVNAAGPFLLTAERLARVSIEVGCSYIDINGEIDVYMKMDDLARQASSRNVALVSSAGYNAAASCLLLDKALTELRSRAPDGDPKRPTRIGAIRVGMSVLPEVLRGSAMTGLRLVREQVLTIRRGKMRNRFGSPVDGLVKWHEPVGRLERTFDFGDLNRRERQPRGSRRVTSAVNMVDTLVALQVLERSSWKDADSIESYLEMDLPTRAAYQTGSMLASLMAAPLVAAQARMVTSLLTAERPEGRPLQKQAVVVEIDSPSHERLIEWRLTVSSGHAFTTQLVVELVRALAADRPQKPEKRKFQGWQTPADLLDTEESRQAALRGFTFKRQIG